MNGDRRNRQSLTGLQRRAADLAWAAGVLDSEGCFSFHAETPSVKVDLVYKPGLDRLATILGGEVRPNRRRRKGRRQVWRWQLTGDNARGVLRSTLPHLLEKADQAALMLTILPNPRGAMLTPDQRAYRAWVRSELSRMKRIEYPAPPA